MGEDPEEYAGLMNSLAGNLVEGLESELVQRIGDTLWRMKRASRMQNGMALKRIKAAQEMVDATGLPQRVQAYENLERYEGLAAALARRGNGPTAAEIHSFVENVGDDPSEEMKEFVLLLKSLNKLEEGPERKAARRKARAQLEDLKESYRRSCIRMVEKLDEMKSPENLAALVAPRDEKSLLMQRMEDSSLRQLWRLTNMLFKVRTRALTHKRDVKNEGTSGDVYENTGKEDNMSSDKHGFLQENAPNGR